MALLIVSWILLRIDLIHEQHKQQAFINIYNMHRLQIHEHQLGWLQ